MARRGAGTPLALRLTVWLGLAWIAADVLLVLVMTTGRGPSVRVAAVLTVSAGGLAAVAGIVVWNTRPVRRLVESVEAAARQGLAPSPGPAGIREVERLALAVDALAATLGSRLTESERERRALEKVLDALPHGVIVVGRDDRVLYANPEARTILGGVPGRLSGVTPVSLQRQVREARDRTGAVGTDIEVEHGTPVRTLRASTIRFEDDARVLVVIVDVTESRRIEHVRRDFVADASHELKTPVASALASIEALVIAMDRDPGRAPGFAREAEKAVRRLSGIVEDLLDLSRLESSEPAMGSVRLDRVVEEESNRLRGRAREADIELTVTVEPVSVRGSRHDLALAVRNICDNALRYTDPGGSVGVRLGRVGGSAVLEVTDTGAGIPTRVLPRVFERFFRVDPGRARVSGGTGLGLAIVKHVVERHMGSIAVESELGVGTTFRIELPAEG